MTKSVKIGNIHIDAIDMDENVTRVVENLNNLHDEGKLKSVMVVYTASGAMGAAVVGDYLHWPMLCLAAQTLAGTLADKIANGMFGSDEEQDDE